MKLKYSNKDFKDSMKLYRILRNGFLFFSITLFVACQSGGKKEAEIRPLIYEGMPKGELVEILGQPDSVLSGGTVYNADYNKSFPIEKWYYKTRTVMIINDSVKTPQLKER